MINSLLTKLNSMYPLVEASKQDIKLSSMTFSIKQYYAKGLGNVSITEGKSSLGLMKIEKLIINPFERDVPLFSYNRIHTLFKDTLSCEMFDTRIENKDKPKYIEKLNELKDTCDIKCGSNWCDDILLKESLYKKTINKKYLNKVTTDYYNGYLRWSIQVGICDKYLKKAKAKTYTENLLKNGGSSTDMFIKEKGKEYTEKLYREVVFGTN